MITNSALDGVNGQVHLLSLVSYSFRDAASLLDLNLLVLVLLMPVVIVAIVLAYISVLKMLKAIHMYLS